MTERTFIHEIEDKYDLKSKVKVYSKFFTDQFYKKMETYCVKCRRNTENLNPNIFKTKKGRLIMQSKCPDCGFKKSKCLKEQEAKGLLSNLRI